MATFLGILHTLGLVFMALMILNVMILVHEWGHFLAARWRGLKVEKFQIWFGKPIWKKTINGVQYGLGSIPAGGFVALPQMAPMEAIEGRSESGQNEPLPPITPLDKIIVAFAGPLFSFALAVVMAFIVWGVGRPIHEPENPTQIGYVDPQGASAGKLQPGDIILAINGKPVDRWNGQVNSVKWGIISSENRQTVFTVDRNGERLDVTIEPKLVSLSGEEEPPKTLLGKIGHFLFGRPPLPQAGIAAQATTRVGVVMPHSPAAEAGVQEGDVLVSVNGQPVTHPSAYYYLEEEANGQPLVLGLKRGEETVTVTVTPRVPDKPEGQTKAIAGFAMFPEERPSTLIYPTPGEQIRESLQGMKNLLSAIASKSEVSVTHMGGPITIVRTYTNILQQPSQDAWRMVLWFSVLLNVNLAVLNMLPFPVLDGGHITMALIEWIRRRPFNIRVLEYVQTACVLLLLFFFVTITMKDVGDFSGRKGDDKIEFLPRP